MALGEPWHPHPGNCWVGALLWLGVTWVMDVRLGVPFGVWVWPCQQTAALGPGLVMVQWLPWFGVGLEQLWTFETQRTPQLAMWTI